MSGAAEVREWLRDYAGRFIGPDGDLDPMLRLKLDHSLRVAAEIRGLASDLGWGSGAIAAAESLGLLHDAGRFSQFIEYGTFLDSASVDHGERGAEVAAVGGAAPLLDPGYREAVLTAVRHHNDRFRPGGLNPLTDALLRLVRDADKLDIYHVVLSAIERDGFADLPAMLPHLSTDLAPSRLLLEELEGGRACCTLSSVRTLGDFLVLQLSWVYDLGSAPAVSRFLERRMAERLSSALKLGAAEVRGLRELVEGAAEERLAGNRILSPGVPLDDNLQGD